MLGLEDPLETIIKADVSVFFGSLSCLGFEAETSGIKKRISHSLIFVQFITSQC